MTAQDYPVPAQTVDGLERSAVFIRKKCGLPADRKVDVFQLLFGDMPEYLKGLGLTLVARSAGYMAEREAYAAPAAKRIFYRPALLAKLKFGDAKAALIFLHELAHVLLHSRRGGADKAWFSDGNTKVRFASEEESAEWQATNFALCFLAPERSAKACKSAEELGQRFSIDPQHARTRFDILERRKSRKAPPVYDVVRAELTGQTSTAKIMTSIIKNAHELPERCPDCGERTLLAIDSNYYCKTCQKYGVKFQDGDLVGFEF